MAVYWVGRDGNAYLKGDDGQVKNVGTVVKAFDNGAEVRGGASGLGQSIQAQRIDDPVPAPSGGGGGTDKKVLNEAAISNTRKAIESLDDQRSIGYKNIDDDYNSLLNKYIRDAAKNEGEYNDQTVTNTQNLQKNKQNALVGAAQGRRGLRGVLASLGALGGTGRFLADEAVTTEANRDIGGAVDTATENQTSLDKAIGNFREEDEDRRKEAKTSRANLRTELEGRLASKKQQFLQKLAELFADADNTAEATAALNQAGDLNEVIARKTAVKATPFSAKAAAFTPGKLADYLAGNQDMSVDVTSGAAGGNPTILAGRRKRKSEEEEPVAA